MTHEFDAALVRLRFKRGVVEEAILKRAHSGEDEQERFTVNRVAQTKNGVIIVAVLMYNDEMNSCGEHVFVSSYSRTSKDAEVSYRAKEYNNNIMPKRVRLV